MELIFLEYFFPRLIPHKGKFALSRRYYWKLLNALGQYGLNQRYCRYCRWDTRGGLMARYLVKYYSSSFQLLNICHTGRTFYYLTIFSFLNIVLIVAHSNYPPCILLIGNFFIIICE